MNRIRTATIMAVVGVLATGAGAVASGQPNLHVPARAAANKRFAQRDVHKLITLVVLPSGAMLARRDPATDGALPEPAFEAATPALVDLHRFYLIAGEQPSAVLAWFQGHVPAGSSRSMSGSGSGPGYSFSALEYSFRSISRALVSRDISVSVAAARGGGTAIRIDAQDIWWVPRPRSERVPAGVQLIDVTVQRLNPTSTTSLTVTDAAKVRRIVSLVNALPPAQPGAFSCPADFGPDVALSFRASASATPLARAVAQGSGCGGVSFTLHGRSEPGLSDGYELVSQLEKLLGFSG
jgi:hypothetical protein